MDGFVTKTVDMKISEEFLEQVLTKALALVREGKNHDYVDEPTLGKIGVFIDDRPEIFLLKIDGNDVCEELGGRIIYVGGSLR